MNHTLHAMAVIGLLAATLTGATPPVTAATTDAAMPTQRATPPAAQATAKTRPGLDQQVARAVADLSTSRVKQLSTGEWLRERFEIELIGREAGAATGLVRARVAVRRSVLGPEAKARAASLPMAGLVTRFEVELRFEPDAAWGQWIFAGGRYWILDEQGQRRVELTMFPDLLLDAPVDAPHELAWAIMSP